MDVFSVYIIYSPLLDKYYVGYTIDIEKRLIQHNTGISTYTSKTKDWELRWIKQYKKREEAMKKEKTIKAKKSRKYIEWLISSTG